MLLLFVLLGLGAGAVYALLALGLVLKHRSTGVIDFAHGAVAMYCAYVFVNLRSTGALELPWIVLPHRIQLASEGMDILPALGITLVYGTALGLGLFFLVYRPLLAATPLTRVCASVGVMLGLQAIAVINFGTTSQTGKPVLPSSPVTVAGITFPSDRIMVAAIVIVVAAILQLVYRLTRFGIATRASAENQTGAALVGISPTAIAARNWGIASFLAAGSGVLITPISALDPTSYTLFVVPALGAALIGGFQSFWITAGAGLLLGVVQSVLIYVQSVVPWVPQQGLADGFPFLIILIAMAVSAPRLGARGGVISARNPSLGRPTRPVLTTVIWFVIGAIVLIALQGSLRAAYISSLITICICLSLVVLTGYIGQVSLAQMTFVGVGSFLLSHLGAAAGLPFPLPLLIAALAVVPLGIVIGLPALRVRGVSLAVVTLAAAAAFEALVFGSVAFSGGLAGRVVPPPSFFGFEFGTSQGETGRIVFGLVTLLTVSLVAFGVARLRNSATGKVMIAIRSNERAAAYMGIRVEPMKLYAFALSSFIAGIAGGLLAYDQGSASAPAFAVFTSLSVLAIVYVAGVGRIAGAVIAGVMFASTGLLVSVLDKFLHIGQYQMFIAGVALALTAVLNPDGVASDLVGDRGLAPRIVRLRDRIFPPRTREKEAPVLPLVEETADAERATR